MMHNNEQFIKYIEKTNIQLTPENRFQVWISFLLAKQIVKNNK